MLQYKQWILAGTISLLGVAIYWGALDNEPVFQDPLVVMGNPVTELPFDLAAHFNASFWGPHRPEAPAWRPLATLTLSWNRVVHGLSPTGYRLVNLLLHGAATFLVILLALEFQLGLAAASLVGVLFASHPLHVETVVTFAGRAELLMTVCALLGFWLFERRRYISSALCIGLSLLSHELALVAAIWIVWRYWTARVAERDEPRDHHWWWTVPIALAAAWFVARSSVLGFSPGTGPEFIDNPLAHLPYAERSLPALSLHLRALGLFVAPFSLAADLSYASFVPESISALAGIAGGVFLCGALGATLFTARIHPVLSCLLALWTFGYLLVSQLGLVLPTVFCERNLYLPSIGLLLALGFALKAFVAHRRFRTGTLISVILVAALFTLRTAVRVEDWKTPEVFYRALLRDEPKNLKAITHLVRLEFAAGNSEAALDLTQKAMDVGGSTWMANLTAAQVHIGLQNGREAAEYLAAAEKLSPGRANIVSARCAHSARFAQPGAVAHCRSAETSGSDLKNDTMHLAVALSNAQQLEEAEKVFLRALALEGDTGVTALHGYAIFLARKGDLTQARALLLMGLKRQPQSALLAQTLNRVDQQLRSTQSTAP